MHRLQGSQAAEGREVRTMSITTMNRYKPNGTPLTDHERELLVILMEECAEVTQAASKLLRFGKENRPDSGVSNSAVLGLEIGDLQEMILMATNAGLVDRRDVGDGVQRKRERLAHFMQTSLT
jgi:hypothetical protein